MKYLILVALIGLLLLAPVFAATQSDASDQQNSAAYAKQLSSTDPALRQSAAEELGRLVALDQKKMVEGYLLQEKDKRVRLALTWALYRMGKASMLFQLVRELDSSRHDQAVAYLSKLESPDSLYMILNDEDTRPKTVVGIIEVLGQIGDSEALQQIKPFEDSYDSKIAEAAKASSTQIQQRLGEVTTPTKTRPRTTSNP
jgi:HEAT repeat protein